MRVLSAVVVAQASRIVAIAQPKSRECGTIRSQTIRDDDFRLDMLVLQ